VFHDGIHQWPIEIATPVEFAPRHNERTTMSQTLHLGDVEVDKAELADLCRRYQVRDLSLFGSAARGEMRPDSDIDLLVEFLPNAQVGLVEHAGLMLDLERLLGRKVDLVSKNGLKPRIRSSVLADARLVYAA
jgi:predicted nucleotidyltransferase